MQVYIRKEDIDSLWFILDTYIDTHNYEGNVHTVDLAAAKRLLDKLSVEEATHEI